jgi:hypothetical protein
MTNQAWAAGGSCLGDVGASVTGKSASGFATAFMPYITLTFTDHFGGTYTTAPIQIQVMDVAADLLAGSEASININHAAATAQAVQKALESLPNHVIPSVQVTGRTETISGAGPGYLVKDLKATDTPNPGNPFTTALIAAEITAYTKALPVSTTITAANANYAYAAAASVTQNTATDPPGYDHLSWATDGVLNPFITKRTASMGGVGAGRFLGPTQAKLGIADAGKAFLYNRRVAVYRMNPTHATKMKNADSSTDTNAVALAGACLFKDIKLTIKFNDKATSGKQNTLQCSTNDQTGSKGCAAGTNTMMPARIANIPGVTSTCAVYDNDQEIENGTHEENAQCGNRGSCDTTTGKCNCFSGHTGEACDVQSNFV